MNTEAVLQQTPHVVKTAPVLTHRDYLAVNAFARLDAYDRRLVRGMIRQLTKSPMKPRSRRRADVS